MGNGSALGVTNLRQLAISRSQGCCVGLLDDIRQIQTVARQLFQGILGRQIIDPATLEKMLWSLDRQIEAGQDLHLQLVDCGADEETQEELADLIAYFEGVSHTVAGRLGAHLQAPKSRPH